MVPTFPQATLPAEPNLAKAVTAEIHGVEEPRFAPRSVENIFEAQVALARRGFSSGSIDGLAGGQTKAALLAFQKAEGLPITGALDAETGLRLLLSIPPLTEYFLTSGDLARLQPLGRTWLEKSQQMALEHESALEFISEKFYSHPTLIRRLNPSVNWTEPGLNAAITVPNVEKPPFKNKAAWIRIELRRKILQAFDSETNLLVHFPCSIAQKVDKRPVGELHVAVLAPNPNYLFDPENFPESTEARELNRKLMLPPGPNNPVGTAWIGLDRPGYGIHGTPKPEEVGRTESHGCFRLANWNAEHLLRLVSPGVPVLVEP